MKKSIRLTTTTYIYRQAFIRFYSILQYVFVDSSAYLASAYSQKNQGETQCMAKALQFNSLKCNFYLMFNFNVTWKVHVSFIHFF